MVLTASRRPRPPPGAPPTSGSPWLGLEALSSQGNQSLEMEEQGSEARFQGWGPGLALVASVVGETGTQEGRPSERLNAGVWIHWSRSVTVFCP